MSVETRKERPIVFSYRRSRLWAFAIVAGFGVVGAFLSIMQFFGYLPTQNRSAANMGPYDVDYAILSGLFLFGSCACVGEVMRYVYEKLVICGRSIVWIDKWGRTRLEAALEEIQDYRQELWRISATHVIVTRKGPIRFTPNIGPLKELMDIVQREIRDNHGA